MELISKRGSYRMIVCDTNKEEGKGNCIDIEDETYAEVYFYFKYKKVIDMMYPRIHICSEDQREFLVEELGKRKNKYEVFKLIFIHEK
mmetsp:Transcript_38082/g.37583  ORF Transcript_38082/g.37583 Transcript_38082/m.37583 type:complete len:88 (+) Transcript_38082:174-437(+)